MDVVVVGSCMADLVSTVPRLPALGETIHGTSFSVGFGGKGANQCVVAARLGCKAGMVAKVGEDTFGHNYLENFKQNKVNTDYVGVTKDAATGVATISVTENGDNAIVIVSGANLLLNMEDLQNAEKLIMGAKVVVCQLETKQQTSLAALKMAKKNNGIKTILNPAPAVSDLDPELYTHADIFCPNETETQLLTGKLVQTVDDASDAIKILQEKGCKAVIITLGEKGTVFSSQPGVIAIHVPCQPVTPVDTTGAGDAFVGALAFYLATRSDLGLEESIKRASSIATVSVKKPGTQTSFPFRKDLPEALFC